MNNDTKNKLTSGTDQADLTSGNACWETPPLVFAALKEAFGPFDVDLTADATRHLCAEWLGPDSNVGEFDALSADWQLEWKNGYSNPPYGPFVQKMLAKAKQEAWLGFTSTLLLPLRVTKAFKSEVVIDGASDVLLCDTRLTFFENGVPRLNEKQWQKGRSVADPAVFDSVIVRFVGDAFPKRPRLDIFHVPKHVTKEDLERAAARRRQRELNAA